MPLTKKEKTLIAQFQKKMVVRMEQGSEIYGKQYLTQSIAAIKKEAEDELLDFANYIMQIYMKLHSTK